MRVFCPAAGTLFAASLIASLASAAEPKPDYALKTRFVDISVSLDAPILANAALAADSLM
jgi:hypothetical protein